MTVLVYLCAVIILILGIAFVLILVDLVRGLWR